MPSLYLPMSGVNTKQKTIYAPMSGINTKQKAGYGLMAGVNTKVFSGSPVLGEIISLGGYTWTVLDVNAAAGKAVILCNTKMGQNPFDSYTGHFWGDCTLKNLVESYYNAFSAEDKAKIVKVDYTYSGFYGGVCTMYPASGYLRLLAAGEIGAPDTVPANSEGLTQLQWFQQHTPAEASVLFGPVGGGQPMWTRSNYSGVSSPCVIDPNSGLLKQGYYGSVGNYKIAATINI